jgi:hypothetical protein
MRLRCRLLVPSNADRAPRQVVVSRPLVRHQAQKQLLRRHAWDEIREWKRQQEEKGLYPMMWVQPRCQKLLRLDSRLVGHQGSQT